MKKQENKMSKREIQSRLRFLNNLICTVDDQDRYNALDQQIKYLEEALTKEEA